MVDLPNCRCSIWLTVAKYATIVTPTDAERWELPSPDLGMNRSKGGGSEGARLQRRNTGRKKIRQEDLVNVLSRTDGTSMRDPWEDDVIEGKAIVLKMPERSMRTYFVPLPADLDVPLCARLH
jgi:hypothetical protein